MVTKTINETLIDLKDATSELILLVQSKIIGNLYTKQNDGFGKKYIVEITDLKRLLNGIDSRLRNTQLTKLLYFDTIDFDILCRNSVETKISVDGKFDYSTFIVEQSFSANDPIIYLELIETNLQTFVMAITNILENLVRLKEILFRKVIIYGKKTAPISSPLPLYFEFLEILVSLKYRTRDDLYNLFDNHRDFVEGFLPLLTEMRNRITHGCPTFLIQGKGEYLIDLSKMEASRNSITQSDPRLIADQFVNYTFTEVSSLVTGILTLMIETSNQPATQVPH